MNKLLITGPSGFAGQNLSAYLKDFDIQKLSVMHQPDQKIAIKGAEAIIHLSGKAHDLKKFRFLKIITQPISN